MNLLELFSMMNGPEFLMLYAMWFFLVFIMTNTLRHKGFDSALTTVGCLVLFEGLGIARIIVGSQHDLHRWGFLVLMMLVGGVLLLVRITSMGGGGGPSGTCGGGHTGATGVSCGGGSSCGAGGCGGCGGS